jgi:single-stranded DNA-binding protein
MTPSIFLEGRIYFKSEVKKTKNDRDWIQIILETTLARETSPGVFQNEVNFLPVKAFSFSAGQIRNLRKGDTVTIAVRLSGTRFESPEGTKHGVQLICERVLRTVPSLQAEFTLGVKSSVGEEG